MIYQVPINLNLWQKLFSLTETFVCDRKKKKILWQKLFFLTEFFLLLWQKCVSMSENQKETCLCGGILFSEGNLFSDRIFCLTETYLCEKNFLSVTEISFCHRIFFLCYSNFFSVTETYSVKNSLFGHVLRDFQGKVSMIIGSFSYLG